MSRDQFGLVVRNALERAWGMALDVSTSKDFRREDGSLDEDAYLRAQTNMLDMLTAEILASPARRGASMEG